MTLPLDAKDLGRSISERFDEIAAVHAGKLAVATPHTAVTYAELKARSDRAATIVLERSPRAAHREAVVVVSPQGVDAIAAQLGILRAGAFYVPADARDAPARVIELAAHVGSRLVMADSARARSLRDVVSDAIEIVDIAEVRGNPRATFDTPYPDAGQLAYVYYTSGSTGSPKGVADIHRNVIHNVLRYTRSLGITAGDRLTLLQPPSFSGAVSSTYAALLNGATLLPYDLYEDGPDGLAAFMAHNQATIYHSVPSIFRNLVAGRAHFPSMRYVRLEGDRALGRDARAFQAHFQPPCQLVNGLGTTETGLVRQYFVTHETTVEEGPLPIGYAVADTECLVVDEAGAPVADGERGEIVVVSRYLATGYWNDEALTQRKFEQQGEARRYRTGDFGRMRPDGCLEYLGRSEAEPRIRGATIDRAAVERALLRIAGVIDAAVSTTQRADGDAVLVAAVAVSHASGLNASNLREALRAEVPERAMPTRFVVVESLPLTAFGKIDRAAIARMVEGPAVSEDEARDEIERQVASIWKEVLGLEQVNRTLGFLDHGGDSLQAMQILVRMSERFGMSISPLQFFSLATIAEQAAFLRDEGGADAGKSH